MVVTEEKMVRDTQVHGPNFINIYPIIVETFSEKKEKKNHKCQPHDGATPKSEVPLSQ